MAMIVPIMGHGLKGKTFTFLSLSLDVGCMQQIAISPFGTDSDLYGAGFLDYFVIS